MAAIPVISAILFTMGRFFKFLWEIFSDLAGSLLGKRNPWEKSRIDRTFRSLGLFWERNTSVAQVFFERHQTPLGWISSLLMLTILTIIVVSSLSPTTKPKTSKFLLSDHSASQNPEVLQGELEKLLAENNFPAAREVLGKLQHLWPQDARLFQAEGAVLMLEKSDFQRARLAFQKALALSPHDAELVFNIAEAEFALGNYAEAENNYRLFRTANSDSELIPFRLYLCAIKQKKHEEAESILNNASVIYQSPSWCYIRAVRAAETGNTRQARELVQLARLLHGKKTRIFDDTLTALGLDTIARSEDTR